MRVTWCLTFVTMLWFPWLPILPHSFLCLWFLCPLLWLFCSHWWVSWPGVILVLLFSPLRTWYTLLVVIQSPYLLIRSDMYVCHTPALNLTTPLTIQLVAGDHFVLAIYGVGNASFSLCSKHNGILPFCGWTSPAYAFIPYNSFWHQFLSVTYSPGQFSPACPCAILLVCLPLTDFRNSNLRHISEWSQPIELFQKLT